VNSILSKQSGIKRRSPDEELIYHRGDTLRTVSDIQRYDMLTANLHVGRRRRHKGLEKLTASRGVAAGINQKSGSPQINRRRFPASIWFDVIADRLTFVQPANSCLFDRGNVDEHIL
jgi:hypothetical protein